MSNKLGKKYAMYLRISREHGENEDTLRNHRDILTEFAKRENMEFDVYEEIVSGMKQDISEREEFHKIFQNAESYAGIIVLKLDRLARQETVAMQFKDLCIDYELPIVTPSKTYDLKNQSDAMMYSLESIFSATEGKSIAYRNKINKIIRARRGEWVSASPAYGYKRNPDTKKLEIYEPEAEVIRYIFKMHSQGYGAFKIRDILNEEGYSPQRASVWNLPSIKRIIRNEVYKGTIVFLDRKRIKRGNKYVYETVEEIRCENAHPAIIPEKEWEAANKERDRRADHFAKIREKPMIKSEVTMLKDLIYCGNCGRKMTIRKDNKSSVGYTLKRCEYLLDNGEKCPNRGIKLDVLEDEIWEEILLYKGQLEENIKLIEQNGNVEIAKEFKRKIAQLESKLIEIKKQDKKLIELALSGIFSHEELREKKQEIEDERRYLENKIEEFKTEETNIDTEEAIDHSRGIIKLIDSVPYLENPEEVNEILKVFIKRINYTRLIPEDLLKLSAQNKLRSGIGFGCTIEVY